VEKLCRELLLGSQLRLELSGLGLQGFDGLQRSTSLRLSLHNLRSSLACIGFRRRCPRTKAPQ